VNETDLAFLSIADLTGRIRRREVSPVEALQASLNRFGRLDGQLNSVITLMAEEAEQAARAAEREIVSGLYRGPLHGVPVGLKDLVWTKGVRTTCGSKILTDFTPEADATVATRLKQAGAVIVAKLNMHEFAYGATSTSPHFGTVHNPWDTGRITGGSSGGSGAAVAAGLCWGALGTDTGGSIRIPASLCGIAGLKPTYGRVSRHGVVPLAWSLDHVGPMTRTVQDAALLLGALAGADPADAACRDLPVPDYTAGLNAGVAGLRVGVFTDLFDRIDPEVEAAVRTAVAALENMGAAVSSVSLPDMEHGVAAALVILYTEATAYHETTLRTRPEDYGEDVRLRLEQGMFVTGLEYVKAQRLRTRLGAACAALFDRVDVLVGPTTPIAAMPPEVQTVTLGGVTEDPRGALTRTTRLYNLLGLPAMTVPCGFTPEGLPVGLQIAGRPFDETTVLRVAHAYEAATPWHTRRPPV
jgi:aspartyl-tRNA(Asn)/glutamyl-tRNA(Gln) amidotransferase subunit A